MADTTLSPNMNLPVPNVSVAPGPDWATDINACLSGIDSHTHASGQGVAVTPAGLNINSDLTFVNNNATDLRSSRYTSQSAPIAASGSDLDCTYVSGGDLYYNDGAGNQVRITQSGSVTGSTGTITGLPSGTASASFAGSTFTFQSATSTPATMAVGPLFIGRNAASSKTVSLTPNAAQASNYDMTFPAALPAALNYVTLDNTGAISYNTQGATGAGHVVLSDNPALNIPVLTTPTISDPVFSGTISGVLSSAAYTPTASAGASGTAQAAVSGTFSYTRINNRVTVFGQVSGTTDSAGDLFVNVTLPIDPSSNFASASNLVGVAGLSGSGFGIIQAKTGDKKASIQLFFSGVGTPTGETASITFTYSCA